MTLFVGFITISIFGSAKSVVFAFLQEYLLCSLFEIGMYFVCPVA